MECKKNKAKVAMETAEKKVTEKDYKGAKRFANKAQQFFPELDGLSMLIAIISVYMSGAKTIRGEADWYGILGVDPIASDIEIRKQYLKLALILHPDKNKFKSAEGAFKLLSEAWSLLSDKEKRDSYNKKRKIKGTQRQSTNPPQDQPTTSKSRKDKSSVGSHPSASSMDKESESSMFWTKCDKCRTLHEYQRVYVNQHLRCKTCKDSFIAVEIIPERDTFWTQCDMCHTHFKHRWVYIKNFLVCQVCQGSFVAEEKPPPSHIPEDANVSSNQQHQSSKKRSSNVAPQAQDRGKREFEVGESQERDGAKGFTDSDLRDFKRMKTDADSHVSGPFSGVSSNQTGGTSNPAKGDTQMPDIIGRN